MSYCHLLSGGMSNINLTFDTSGTVVSDVLRAGAVAGVCIGPPCGDGILDAGEDCDDGNITNGDCCSSTCTAEPDGNACDDDEFCTSNDECASGVCVGTPVANGTPCDDGSVCTTDTCQAGACVGAPAPAAGCKVALPTKSQLQMKDKSPDKGDQVKFKWTKGAITTLAEFGDPLTSDDYTLCVYEAGPAILATATAPAGGLCDGSPCWKTVGGGYKYKDKLSTPNGMAKVQLKEGLVPDKAKVQAQAKGVPLDMPVLGSLSLPLTRAAARSRRRVLRSDVLDADQERRDAVQGQVGLKRSTPGLVDAGGRASVRDRRHHSHHLNGRSGHHG